ncbi:O-antigen ligase family protein [Pirellulaceae bacterium SH449]
MIFSRNIFNTPVVHPSCQGGVRGATTDIALFCYVFSLAVAASDEKYVFVSTCLGGIFVFIFIIEHLLFRPFTARDFAWIKFGGGPLIVFAFFATLVGLIFEDSNPERLLTLYQLVILYLCTFFHVYRTGGTSSIAFGLTLGLLAIWYFAGASFTEYKMRVGERFRFSLSGEGEGMNPNVYGIYLITAGWFLLRDTLQGRGLRSLIFSGFRIGFAAICMILFAQQVIFTTGSRKAQIGLMLLVGFSGFIFRRRVQQSKFLSFVGVIGAVALPISVFYFISESAYWKRFENMITFAVEGSDSVKEVSISGRYELILEAFQLWSESPFFGHGFDAFRNLSFYGLYSHSNYLELLANLGVIGFVLYYWTHVRGLDILKNALRNRGGKNAIDVYWIAVGWIFVIMIWDPFSVTYESKINYIILACLIGLSSNFSGKQLSKIEG